MNIKWARVGFTGTRKGLTPKQHRELKALLADMAIELHHGSCVGADEEAMEICLELGIPVVAYPTKHRLQFTAHGAREIKPMQTGKNPELTRNHKIVDVCDVLIACPKEDAEVLRSGTWACIRYAKRHKPVIMLWPHAAVTETEFEKAWNEIMNDPRELCMCGDYRYEHPGDGACRTCQQHSHQQLFAPCQKFRSAKGRL